jgi:hypothetical protein
LIIFGRMEQKWANNLNNDEFNLIQSIWYPQLKKSATEKVKAQLFGLGNELENVLPGFGFKISSGENYKDLPYLVLDFPKISGPQFPVLFRTLFWWGKYVSFQVFVHIPTFVGAKSQLINSLENSDWVLTNENLWSNDIQSGDFKQKQDFIEMEIDKLSGDYIKIMRVVEMQKPDNLFEEAIGFYHNFFSYVLTSKKSS